MTTLLAVVIPMFAGTSTVIVRYFAQHRHDSPKGKRVNVAFATLTWLLPVVFTFTILLTIVLRATNRAFDDFDQAKLFLAGLEALFVAYIAYVLAPLFDADPATLRAPTPDTQQNR
jgi:Na+/proline symporter